jgi:hypothetical protein
MDKGNSFALTMIAFGLVILVAGCGVAIYRQQEAEKETNIETDLIELVKSITKDYTSGSGAVSLGLLGSSDIQIDSERSARIHVETMDGDVLTLFIPDEETYNEMVDDASSTTQRTIPVATDDGRVLPGKLEVTLNG